MNIMIENITTGIVKPTNGISEFERKKEAMTVSYAGNTAVERNEGELSIGLGSVSIIPTGSVFVPRELFMPQQIEPLQMEIIPQSSQNLIPQEIDEIIPHNEEQNTVPVIKENIDTENNAPTEQNEKVHKIDITA